MQKVISESLGRTEAFAKEFIDSLQPKKDGATVVCLKGNLGSGKTAFVQSVAKLLGVDDTVTSPTFVIEKLYATKDARFPKLFHIDAYRLQEGSELKKLGWDDMIQNAGHIVFIEWPENVAGIIPEDALRLTFTFIDDATRGIVRE